MRRYKGLQARVFNVSQATCDRPVTSPARDHLFIEMEPAKLLAVFVVDTNQKELTIPFGN